MRSSVIIAILIAVAATGWILSGQIEGGRPAEAAPPAADDGGDPAAAEARQDLVQVIDSVALETDDRLSLHARTEAFRTVNVAAETVGQVAEILVERGQVVSAGEVLVRLDLDTRDIAVAEAEAQVAQRQIEFDAAEELASQGFNSEIRKAEAQSLLAASRYALAHARMMLERVEITAPFGGVVDDRMVEIGDFVDVGQPVAMIVDLDPIKVVGAVAEQVIGDISPGMAGTAEIVGIGEVAGRVAYISRIANPATRTFEVELLVDNADRAIAAGLTAELVLPLASASAHRVSPSVLSLADDGTVGVKIVDADQRARFVPVEILGDASDGMIWLGGLPETIRLITIGHEFVAPGQPVRAGTTVDRQGPRS